MAELKGHLFDPLTSTTRPVVLVWHELEQSLHVEGERFVRDVPGREISVATGGWQGQSVVLSWAEDLRGYALVLSERETIRALAGLLSASLARELEKAIADSLKAESRGRRTFLYVGLLVLLPILLLLALWLARGPLVDAVLRRLPTAVDTRLGALAFEQTTGAGHLVDRGPAADAVQRIASRLSAAAPSRPFTFHFAVKREASVNAFATPGGWIVVHTGLLAAAHSPDEVAGVLAHEMTHVLERHTLRQIVFQAGLTTAARLLLGSGEGAFDLLSGAASDLTTLRFSREQERAADQGALRLLRAARLPTSGLASLFGRLAHAGDAPPAWLSSHPDSAARAAAVAVVRAPDEIPLEIDWPSVQQAATVTRP